jgi:hypothetical protein
MVRSATEKDVAIYYGELLQLSKSIVSRCRAAIGE